MQTNQITAPMAEGAAKPARKPGRSPGRPTREQVELRNRELLDKALDHFLEKGFERTTIDAITASLGMAKRTVYARYGDKAALFKAALQRAIDEWIVPVERLHAAERDDLEETLLNIARILIANIMSPAGIRLLRITNTESYRMPDIGAYTYRRGTAQTIAYLVDLFERRLAAHRVYIREHLEDLPEIANWRWTPDWSEPSGAVPEAEAGGRGQSFSDA